MQIRADSQLFERAGDLKIGIISYHGMIADVIPTMLVGRLQLFIEHLHTELESKTWNAYEMQWLPLKSVRHRQWKY